MNFIKINEAVQFASVAHDGQYRKKLNVPYISHPCTAAIILMSYLPNTHFSEKEKEEMVVATILHDVWEDTDVTLEEIEERFGKQVAEYVKGASEQDKSLPWEERKRQKIEALKTKSLNLKYIVCADKVHNLLSIIEDQKEYGDEVWSRFKRGKREQEWYYRSIYDSLVYGMEGDVPVFFHFYKNLIEQCF